MSRHVVVIGAGIVGVSTAIQLRRDGIDVTLVDRGGPAAGTSYGNAGVLASCSMVPVTGPGLIGKAPKMLFDPMQPLFLKWSYLPKLAPWLVKYLGHANEADTRRIGSAVAGVVGDSLAEHQALAAGTGAEGFIVESDYTFAYDSREKFLGDALAWDIRRNEGVKWTELEGPAFQDYDPIVPSKFGYGVVCGDHGRISDPGEYVKALASHAEALGARFIKAEIEDIAQENGAVSGVRAGGETIPCDTLVIATGVWSGPLTKKLGLKVPLEAERGYHIELWEPSFYPKSPLMIASGKFVMTPMEGRLRLAGMVEFGGLEKGPSKAPFDLLRANIKSAFPTLTWKEETEWMGHRPAPADSIPIIGEAPGVKGAFMGFGHHHIGLTGGPKTGRLLAQMIAGKTPNADMSVYAPARHAA